MSQPTAIIIGAGPAGLTAAYELLQRSNIRPLVLESSPYIGGISRTVNYKGNRMDIGGHRFFSKSDRVMDWWLSLLPLQGGIAQSEISYHHQSRRIDGETDGPDPRTENTVMLVRRRKSRILFLRKLFDYPLSLTPGTLGKLGVVRAIRILMSYLYRVAFPIRPETNLEEFFINRFGRELYLTFFKSYTEKVWGVPCQEISAEWGAQRIKGLSIARAAAHFVKSLVPQRADIAQKNTETSLIEQFLYPKYGPGQLWELVAERVRAGGGLVQLGRTAVGLEWSGDRVTGVRVRNESAGTVDTLRADYVISTMPISKLIAGMGDEVPAEAREVAGALRYRDFMTVGLLLNRIKIRSPDGAPLSDNWIYVQEADVKLGRIQIFNNWSPYMVSDPDKVFLGLEYFCEEGDALWNMDDRAFAVFAAGELARIGFIDSEDVVDSVVVRVPKTYPAYFGAYARFDEVRRFVDRFENLFLVGRNGMHKYNNQDHSMLTAMVAVDNIVAGDLRKDNIWAVNAEQVYHESDEPDA